MVTLSFLMYVLAGSVPDLILFDMDITDTYCGIRSNVAAIMLIGAVRL